MKSFWDSLPKALPAGRQAFVAMAPMADVTDPAFRALVAKCGAPDIFWTEFVSADGLYHTREIGKFKDAENPLMRDLQFSEAERPIVAQIFSSKPEMIAYAAKLCEDLGFDGVDINMGCPHDGIERQGCGSAMIKNPKLAAEIIRAAQAATKLPVSVKTRVGYNTEILDGPASTRDDSTRGGWLPALLAAEPAAITLHLRTRKQMSNVPANWELMKKAVEIRNRVNPNVLLIGNGDITDRADALAKIADASCDGAMIGRGMFGNPWVFAGRTSVDTTLAEKLEALLELAHSFEKLSPPKNFAILKKHIKAFVTGFDGAAELRASLMEANSATELEAIIAKQAHG